MSFVDNERVLMESRDRLNFLLTLKPWSFIIERYIILNLHGD